jgi:signal transduction histidine kinase
VSDDPVNILLVDDKPENLYALEELLRQPDRVLLSVTSGNDALRLLLKHDVAMVLMDVEMPGMDGYETAQLMRTSERSKLVPIIFVTAGDRSEERTFRGYEAGAVDFLYKPIAAHILRSKVEVFTQLFRKTRALEHATRKLDAKVADLEHVNQTLSHDLRAPLRSIRGFSQILVESHKQSFDSDAMDALDRIVRASVRMTAMIEDLYGLLRVSADDSGFIEIDTASVLAEVLETLRSDLEQAQAAVTADSLPVVVANRRLIGQVLQNLIANAVKFRGTEPPRIHVTATRVVKAWQFAVRDNGAGIAESERERVFRLFERIGSAAGTGVGLTLCRRALEKLGGRIWIGNEAEAGTTFYFTIPIPTEPA